MRTLIDRERCRAFALRSSWAECARRFASQLAPIQPLARWEDASGARFPVLDAP